MNRLSRPAVAVFGAAFAAGAAFGAVEYARRPPAVGRHVAGTNAIALQAGLGLVAVGAVTGLHFWQRRVDRGYSIWWAPFGRNAMTRLGRTLRLAGGFSALGLARAGAAVLLLVVMVYAPLRMGRQVTGGLDPNSTVNAWGGPTYLGALLAHWLDGVVMFYAAAFLLSTVLVPRPGGCCRRWTRRPGW